MGGVVWSALVVVSIVIAVAVAVAVAVTVNNKVLGCQHQPYSWSDSLDQMLHYLTSDLPGYTGRRFIEFQADY